METTRMALELRCLTFRQIQHQKTTPTGARIALSSRNRMLRIALVGCGRISTRHAEVLTGDGLPQAELVAVCDLNLDRAEQAGTKYRVPWFGDMHSMMQNVDTDVVAVLTESGHHPRDVFELAQYGKPIIVEKPMALTAADADEMIMACEKSGVPLFVVKQNRYNKPVQKLKEALDQGAFGKVFLGSVRVRWCRTQDYYDLDSWRGTKSLDGGVLANQASHHLDLLEWMLGTPETVTAMTSRALADIETDDTAIATIRFSSGALGLVEATTATRPTDLEGSLSVLGSLGSVVIGGFSVNKMETWNFDTSSAGYLMDIDQASENPPNVYGFGHLAFYRDVVSSITSGEPPKIDGHEGRKSVSLLEAIYKSAETGKEIEVPKADGKV